MRPELVSETWQQVGVDVSFGSGWAQYASWETVRFRRLLINGEFLVIGEGLALNNSGGVKSAGTTQIIYTLPQAYRPTTALIRAGINETAAGVALARVTVNTNGEILFETGTDIPADGWISVPFQFFQ